MKLDIGQPKVRFDSNILDVKIPKEMETAVSTGYPHIDLLFAGDGIVPSSVALVTGVPGSGKSTLMLQVANSITRKGYQALYNTGEESLYQIRRTVKRLRLKDGFIPAYHKNVDQVLEHCDKLRKSNPQKQLFLFVDSLQCLEPSKLDPETGKKLKGRPTSGLNAQVTVTTQLTEYAKKHFIILFLIGHVTKKGEFAGRGTIKHIIDCHLHLGIDQDTRSDSYGERICEMLKNRFGIAGTYYNFDLLERGVVFETTAPLK